MFGIIKSLFASENAVNKGLDAITRAGDAMVFTKEEKSNFWLRLLQAYEPFKIAQRLLALIFGIPFVGVQVTLCLYWLFLLTVMVAFPETQMAAPDMPWPASPDGLDITSLSAVPPISTSPAGYAMQSVERLMNINLQVLGTPVSMIMAFYFGGGFAEGVIRARWGTPKENIKEGSK